MSIAFNVDRCAQCIFGAVLFGYKRDVGFEGLVIDHKLLLKVVNWKVSLRGANTVGPPLSNGGKMAQKEKNDKAKQATGGYADTQTLACFCP